MITNPDALTNLQTEWDQVMAMRDRMRHLVISTFIVDQYQSPAFGNVVYNLPFLLAFDVLRQVLLQAEDEGHFAGSYRHLAGLMESAKTSLPWNDWQCIREGVERRNEVAQCGKLLGDIQCLQDIAAIESQLIAWRIIAAS